MAGLMGLEPTTFRVTGGRSNQTELQPPKNGEEYDTNIVLTFCQKSRFLQAISSVNHRKYLLYNCFCVNACPR